jgi:hypothetical protein
MAGRPRKHVVLTLTAEDWDRLVALGRAEERDPYQQARWLLLRGLDGPDESAVGSRQSAVEAEPDTAVA